MRKQAFEYYTTQPGFTITMQPKIFKYVVSEWHKLTPLRKICEELLSSEIGIESVIRFKKYLSLIITTDLNAEKLTREILYGFIDYIEYLYNMIDGPDMAKEDAFYNKFPELKRIYIQAVQSELNKGKQQWHKRNTNNLQLHY